MVFADGDLEILLLKATKDDSVNGVPLTSGGLVVVDKQEMIYHKIHIFQAEVRGRHMVVTSGWYEKGKFNPNNGTINVCERGAIGAGYIMPEFRQPLGSNSHRKLYHLPGFEPTDVFKGRRLPPDNPIS